VKDGARKEGKGKRNDRKEEQLLQVVNRKAWTDSAIDEMAQPTLLKSHRNAPSQPPQCLGVTH
jgi:transposase